jgi:hypothetical protein
MQDTFSLVAMLSQDSSVVNYKAGNSSGDVLANFDLRQLPAILKPLSNKYFKFTGQPESTRRHRKFQFNFQLDNPNPFKTGRN